MKRQYTAPTSETLEISVEKQILASSEIDIDTGNNNQGDKLDAPDHKKFGNIWDGKGW